MESKWLKMPRNGSKWAKKKTNIKKHKAAGAGVNGSKWAQKKTEKKTDPPARGKTGVPSKVKTIWRGSIFFFETDPGPGGPLRVRERGGPFRFQGTFWLFPVLLGSILPVFP